MKIAYTAAHAAEMLDMSENQFNLLVKAGLIKGKNIGQGQRPAMRYAHEELLRFMKEGL